jgi:hypothetical protein
MSETGEPKSQTPRLRLICPCGEMLRGETEDELVEKAQEHLAAEHPGHSYTRDEILFMAY